MSPLAPRYATFRDVGAVLESTRGVSQAQRDLLQSWSRDQGINAPLSRGMVAASPRHTYGYSPSAGRSVDMRQRKGGVPRIATFSADADDQEVPDRALNIKQLSQIVETSVENSDEDENEKAKESLYGFYHHRQPHHTADTSLVSTTTADDLGMRQLSVYSEKDTSGKAAAELRIGTFSGSEHEMGLLLRQASGESEQGASLSESMKILHDFYGIPLTDSPKDRSDYFFTASSGCVLVTSTSGTRRARGQLCSSAGPGLSQHRRCGSARGI
jgi:hypothetical protein